MKTFKVNGYLDYSLESVVITTKGGSEVRTFNLKYGKKMEAIKKVMLTDGMWMLVSNITKTIEPEEYRLDAEKFISIYRDKNRV